MKKTLPYIYILVAVLGFIDATYLTYTRLAGITPPCSISILSGCATVAKSSYSVVLGIPLSVFGMIFYAFGATVAVLLVLKKLTVWNNNLRISLLALSVLGAISSAYFTYLQAFVIKAFCIYCVFSALCSLALLILAIFIYNKKTKFNS
jgi:uncharacterized membrane protein